MIRLQRTQIDWCDYSWNPVWGCRNSCPYCYARKIAKRWGKRVCGRTDFVPTWVESNFQKAFPRKPARIFVNSMSDCAFWEAKWWTRVLRKIQDYPQHTFLFLTKLPGVYLQRADPFSSRCWLGVTVESGLDLMRHLSFLGSSVMPPEVKTFISFEPLVGPVSLGVMQWWLVDWIIIGAETGNRKGRVEVKREWVTELVKIGTPVFMKESLRELMGDDFLQEYL